MPKKKGKKRKYAMGGKVGDGLDYYPRPRFNEMSNIPLYQQHKHGGKVKGNSHKKGGVPIEVEGGEYIIKKDSVNAETKPVLEAINRTGTVKKGLTFPLAKNKYKEGK